MNTFASWGRWTAPVRDRWQAWWGARHPRCDHLVLTQRNVYILPTRAGFMFAITLITLLLASINYQLNLGYVLTFLLAGSAVVSMHITHGSLRGLNLHLKPIAPVFAGQNALLEVVLQNAGKARYGLGLKLQSAPDTTLAWVDVPALGQTSAHLGWITDSRGQHATPNLTVETRFPLGLFRAWSVWRPAAQVLVYPKPEHPSPPMPPSQSVAVATGGARSSGGTELEGVRAYRRGDALKLVVWKKAAQAQASGGDLVIRDTASTASQELWLDWQHTGISGTEERLSRLAAWVLAAEATSNTSTRYGLTTPGLHLPPDSGPGHRDACLRGLALHP
ncbi:MAG: DUF58 domain-containing protein [Rhizobacter sp.]